MVKFKVSKYYWDEEYLVWFSLAYKKALYVNKSFGIKEDRVIACPNMKQPSQS